MTSILTVNIHSPQEQKTGNTRRVSAEEIRRQPEYQYILSGAPVPGAVLLQRTRLRVSSAGNFIAWRLTSPRQIGSAPTSIRKFHHMGLGSDRAYSSGTASPLKKQSQVYSVISDKLSRNNVFETADSTDKIKDAPEDQNDENAVREECELDPSDKPPKRPSKSEIRPATLNSEIERTENSATETDFPGQFRRRRDKQSENEAVSYLMASEMRELSLNFNTESVSCDSDSPFMGCCANDDRHSSNTGPIGTSKRSGVQFLADNDDHGHSDGHKPRNNLLKTILQDDPARSTVSTNGERKSLLEQPKISTSGNTGVQSFGVKGRKSFRIRKMRSGGSHTIEKHFSAKDLLSKNDSPDCEGRKSPPARHQLQRGKSQYDAKLEKSSTYLHARSRTFTRASQYMSNTREELTQLNVHYSQTNISHNDRIIMRDLLKTAHVKTTITGDNVYNLERRLYTKRQDPARATTFYDRFLPSAIKHSTSGGGQLLRRKFLHTVAEKKRERKKRIRRKNEEIELGYTPRAWSLTEVGQEEISHMLDTCRYLRVDSRRQPRLYGTLTSEGVGDEAEKE